MNRRLIILGSTGSIGTQALEVVEHINALHAKGQFPFAYEVVGLAMGQNVKVLDEQSRRFPLAQLAIAHPDVRDMVIAEQGMSASFSGRLLRAHHGQNAAEELVREVPCDFVLAAMVGSAGLPATLAAIELGRDIALANKETLVAAGSLIIPAAQASGSKLLPVDSEHAALWQCLTPQTPPPLEAPKSLSRAILTASGGPFRTWSKQQAAAATPDQALKHPTWSMGRKVTIDSASLMNKALEVIEAHWLFGLPADKIDALIHPQSLIHALAEFEDGSLIAQLAAPDMRSPIQHAMTWPLRSHGIARRLDLGALASLELSPVDHDRFPLFKLGHRAIHQGGTAGAILSAANEAAVGAFLAGHCSFGRMQEAILDAVEAIKPAPMTSLDDCLAAESVARDYISQSLSKV
jgi:1-deoxy-D-xylulose-5-phosphate reductoisomerase